ncbi:flavodoxin [Vibrio sp. RC27]
MAKVGIFFGTDTGSTRKVAKMIQKQLGDEVADKPKNINRVEAADLASYDCLIMGTPTLATGQLPGIESDCSTESWLEFLPQFAELDLSGKQVALYGMGDQVNYPNEFVDGLGELYDYVANCGCEMVGRWPLDGYEFSASNAVDGDAFVGLVLDKDNQSSMTEERLSTWLEQVKLEMAL